MSNGRSRCARCRSLLASDNYGTYCASCDAVVDRLRQRPPSVPAHFWSHPAIQDAAQHRHMGQLIAAYRRHPHHGIPISQEIVGGWIAVTQGQISRMENGQPEQNLDRLVHWARLLAIPADLLWFTHPTLGTFTTVSTRSSDMGSANDAARSAPGHVDIPPYGTDIAKRGAEPKLRTAVWAAAAHGAHAVDGVAMQDNMDDTGEMFRRTLLLALATYSAGFGASSAGATSVARGGPSVDSLVDEWRQACDEYGFEYHTQPRRDLVADLAGDLLDVHRLLGIAGNDTQVRRLAAVVARLAGLAALACTDLGLRREVKHLWRLGRRMAHLADDADVLQWVYGQEATSGLYFGRPIDVVMTIADQGLAIGDTPTAGRAELLGGKAQALAIVGERQTATRVLRTLEETFNHLPEPVATCSSSILGWPEQRLRHAESFIYSTAGALTLATRAQDRALALYAASRTISRTQIELHRAECLIRAGHISDGARHARETVAYTAEQARNRYILATVSKVVDAVPKDQHALPAVAGLRNDLAAAFGPTAPN